MARLNVKVVPGSSRNRIVGWLGDALKIKVMAPPEKGRANEAVVELLSMKLGIRWRMNHERVERIWRDEGLKVPQKQPKRRRLWFNDGLCIRLRLRNRKGLVWWRAKP